MKKRILFVDDRPEVLQGLRRVLRPRRHEWDLAFAASGREALRMLAAEPADVIVSDMRMPGMSGAELLHEVMRKYPQTVRIILSGHSESESILQSVGPAHQYLAKPCDAETLKATIGKACKVVQLLAQSEPLRRLVSQVDSLPAFPSLYAQVMREVQSSEPSLRKIGQVVSSDIGMTAKILQLVNSAFFGLPREVDNPAQAVGLLGINTIKTLVLTAHIFSQFQAIRLGTVSSNVLWRHSLATGVLAAKIGKREKLDKKLRDQAFMAGLLHDLGKLVLASNLEELYGDLLLRASAEEIPLWQIEREKWGTTHGEVGGYLLALWGLPDPIVDGLAFHHDPSRSGKNSFGVAGLVHVADVLEHEQSGPGLSGVMPELDTEYVYRQGLEERLMEWRSLEAEEATGASQGRETDV
ncbi:MAG: HDOD domain-containing protein [Acidobacteriota bacterium]